MARPLASPQPDVFQAIADPTRRALLDLIAMGEFPVKSLSERFAMSRPAVSQHLRVLREAGLVSEHRVGREHYYQLRPEALHVVSAWVAKYEGFWTERLDALGEQLDGLP